MNNTDLQVRYHKETGKQVLQTGKQMNLYYTDDYIRWLEAKVLQQANGVNAESEKALPIQSVVFSESELKAKLEQQKEEIRQWLIGEDFEGLAERL